MPAVTTVFDLPDRLSTKNDPILIGADEAHLTTVAEALAGQIADLTQRLDELRRSPGGAGRAAMDRDLEIHRLSSDLRLLRRYGLDVCLGRIVAVPESSEAPEPVYIGRIGLADRQGRRLLVDWRTPAAEPFFAATAARPAGLVSRRRYRWSGGRITDFWDEVFVDDPVSGVALDEDSAFIASLGSSRSSRMRDVLATIQADQDMIIRADSRGPLVVDGGPGTGKTVVALHRTAYLLYADPRFGGRRGEVLVVGPHRPYLAYVADVLPSLGEEGVLTGVKCCEVDEKRRPIAGTEFVIRADLAFIAIGFAGPMETGVLADLGERLTTNVDSRRSTNVVANDRDYRTNIDRLYVAGDVRRGQSLVVWAIREGRQAAHAIDLALMGETLLPR